MCVGRPRDCSKSVRRVNSELLFDVVVEPVAAAAVVFDVERVAEEAADEAAPVFAESLISTNKKRLISNFCFYCSFYDYNNNIIII